MTQFTSYPKLPTFLCRDRTHLAPTLSLTLAFVSFLVISALAFGLFAATATAEELGPEAPGSIAGVVKAPDGAPQAKIEMFLLQPDTRSAGYWRFVRSVVTQADGQYRFALLPPGIYRVGLKDQQKNFATVYYPSAPTVESANDLLVTGNQLTGIDFVLQPGGQIAGAISATDRITMTSAEVALYQAVERRGILLWEPLNPLFPQPVVDGRYRFAGLSPNRYRLCAYGRSPEVSIFECYDNVYELERATTLTLTVGSIISDVNIVFGDGANYAQISGRVTTANQTPLAAIQVAAVRAPSGGPPVGRTMSPLFLPQSSPSTPDSASPTTDKFYGETWTRTDDQGNYHLTTIPAGCYYLYFRDPTGNYVGEYYNDAFYSDSAIVIDLAPKAVISDVNVQLQTANRIRGVVTLFGQAAAGGAVSAELKTATGWQHAMTSYTNPITGEYDLGGLPDGVYRLYAYAFINDSPTSSYYYETIWGGNTPETAAEIPLVGGQIKRIDLVLAGQTQFSGSISGRVTAGGVALAGAKVALYSQNSTCCPPFGGTPILQPLIYVFTNQEGRYTINGLTTGSVLLGVTDPSGSYATTYYANRIFPSASDPIQIEDGKALTGVDLNLPQAGAISGRVTRRNGEPVAGLAVSTYLSVTTGISQQPFVSSDTYTGADGRYMVKGLHPGNYYICFTVGDYTECYGVSDRTFPGYITNRNAHINVVAGEIRTNVDLLWGPDLTNYLPIIAR